MIDPHQTEAATTGGNVHSNYAMLRKCCEVQLSAVRDIGHTKVTQGDLDMCHRFYITKMTPKCNPGRMAKFF